MDVSDDVLLTVDGLKPDRRTSPPFSERDLRIRVNYKTPGPEKDSLPASLLTYHEYISIFYVPFYIDIKMHIKLRFSVGKD